MSSLSKNIACNVAGQGLLLVLGFVAVKFVFNRLGPDALGIIYFTLTMNAVLASLLDLGISSTVVREVAGHISDEPDYIRELVRSASLFYWLGYLLLVVGVYLGAPLLVSKWIHLQTLDPGTAVRALRILGGGTLVALPRSVYAGVCRGFQRMEFNNFIDVGTATLQQLGVILVLGAGGGFLHVAYWLLLCFLAGLLVYLCVCARLLSFGALVPGFSLPAIHRNIRYTSRLASTSVLAMIQMQADKAIVSKLLPIGLFGYYGLLYGVVSRVSTIAGAIAGAGFPSLSALFKAGERVELISQYHKLQALVCFALAPLFAAVVFGAPPLLILLFNEEVARLLQWPAILLCLGFYMNGTCTVPYLFSLAVGKPEIGSRQNFYALFLVLPVTAILISVWGLNGAALSWVFYHVFFYAYGVRRICSECLGMPVGTWYAQILRILLPAALTYGAGFALLELAGLRSVRASVSVYLTASALFLPSTFWLMGKEIRERICEATRTRLAAAL